MFTWICPQCGREVPPAYTECPDCAAKAAGAAAPPPSAPPPQPPVYQPPPPQAQQSYPPQPQYPQYPPQYQPPYQQQPQQPNYQQPAYQQPVYQQPPYPQPPYPQPPYQQPQYQQPVYQQPQYQPPPPPQAAPPPPPPPPPPQEPEPQVITSPGMSSLFGAPPAPPQREGFAALPTWVLTIICTIGFVGLVAGIYWLVGRSHAETPSTTVESPAAKPGAATNPWQKFIEVSGVRLQEDPKNKSKLIAKFVVTNHSTAGLSGLAGNVTLWGGTRKSDEDALGTFSFITSLDASESKEITSPLTTKLKVYELPDWQNATPDLQITAPAATGSGGQP